MGSYDSGQGRVRALRKEPGDRSDDRALWADFRQAGTPEAFYTSWLALQCALIEGAQAGLVLVQSARGGAFAPVAHWPVGRRPGRHLGTAAEKALKERRALALELEPQGEGAAGAPSRTCIAQPIEAEGEVSGAVVIELSARSPEQLESALRSLAWGSAWLELSALRQSGSVGGSDNPMKVLLELISMPLEHERFHPSATAFVTELARHFRCDRVAFGGLTRGRVKLHAVSHSALFSERANLTRAIESAMEEALDQEEIVLFPTPPEGRPQVVRCHALLAEIGSSGALCSIPVAHGDRFCGTVTLERPADEPFLDSEIQIIEAACSLAGPMLEIQRKEDRWLIAKALDAARETGAKLVGPRHVALKLGAGAAVLLILLMTLFQADYRVTADTVLEARVLRAAVAPFDGYIDGAPARAGDRVMAGDLLASLDDRELQLERKRWSSQLEQLAKQNRQALAARDPAQVKIYQAQIDQAQAQLSLVAEKLDKTQITAAFDGIVVTGDLSQQLGAPVQRGQLLYEVAPLDEYRVVLEVDERDIDEIRPGQRGSLLFAAFPGEPADFTVERITPVSTPEEGRNTFRVEARLAELPDHLQPGMEGVGKVDIDRRRLIWIWTHEIGDWLRLALWKWLP